MVDWQSMQKDTGRFSDEFEGIVSHPAKQGQIYQIPLAIQREGIPVKFLTGLYYKPEQFPYSFVKFLPPSKEEAK